jgi:hypothetical protein
MEWDEPFVETGGSVGAPPPTAEHLQDRCCGRGDWHRRHALQAQAPEPPEMDVLVILASYVMLLGDIRLESNPGGSLY